MENIKPTEFSSCVLSELSVLCDEKDFLLFFLDALYCNEKFTDLYCKRYNREIILSGDCYVESRQ